MLSEKPNSECKPHLIMPFALAGREDRREIETKNLSLSDLRGILTFWGGWLGTSAIKGDVKTMPSGFRVWREANW